MLPADSSGFEQAVYRLLQSRAGPAYSGDTGEAVVGLKAKATAAEDSKLGASVFENRVGFDPATNLTHSDGTQWASAKLDKLSDVTSRIPDSSQSSTPSWEGSLWSGSNNIWSTGSSAQGIQARKSMDVPVQGRVQAHAQRRSLDSLSTLQAIWQAKQQQHQLDAQSLLQQQLGHLALLDGLPQAATHGPQQQLADVPYPSGPIGLQFQANDLGFSQQASNSLGATPPAAAPLPLNSASHGSPQWALGQLPNLGLGFSGSQNDLALLSHSLSPLQLQEALNDPALLARLRQRLEATKVLSSHLNRPQSLEDQLLLAQAQAANGLPPLSGAGIRQPPPPPPRSVRPQLPPLMAIQTPPKAKPPVAGSKKSSAGGAVRTSGRRDRSALLGSRPKADMQVLGKALEELVESLKPSAEEKQRQDEAFQKVARLLKARWPHCKVEQFGSSAIDLSICNTNDIDVCMEILEPEGDVNFKAQMIEEMGDLLMDAGMLNVLPLPKARQPVVKCNVPDTGTKVDVTVNTLLAMVNTKLLRDYAAIDARLAKLAIIVKHWAKRRQVNDSYRGTLSSYCYVLMCIHHLQTRQPPILPCLQAIQPHTHIRTVGRWSCDYHDKPMEGFGKENKESLAELVWSFFENWAWGHDYNNSVISVRTGGLLTKTQKDWTRRIGNERHLICIEDPFETSHDLGRTVDRQTSGVLHKEFERAAGTLRDQAEPLEQLLEPYRVGKE